MDIVRQDFDLSNLQAFEVSALRLLTPEGVAIGG